MACSSEEPGALNKWFEDQGIASSYGKKFEEIEISVKNIASGTDNSAYMVGSYAALGNVNGIENTLYFDLETAAPLSSVWKFRADSVFYTDIYKGIVPNGQKQKMEARIYWSEEAEIKEDSDWLNSLKPSTDYDDVSLEWKAGTGRDTFLVYLPEKLLELGKTASATNTVKLLVGIELLSKDEVLRIAPSISDISGLRRVAQRTEILEDCEKCLHAGTRESLSVSFSVKEEDKIKIAGKAVVFAQLVLPKQNGTAGSELEHPIIIYVYNDGISENYRIDTAFVTNYGHPNLVFWDKTDSLKLQVTGSLRRYAMANLLPDTIGFVLRLGIPMLEPKSLYFYNSYNSDKKVFSDRYAYARYDFSSAFTEPVKLRLWLADFDDKK